MLDLIRASVSLWGMGRSFELVLVGSHSASMRDAVFGIAGQFGDRVRLPGVLIDNENGTPMREADFFCVPTCFPAETFGIVCLEAMMFSLPVVATDWRGVPEVVQNGETGFVVPVRRSDLLAERLEMLLTNPELRMRLGKAGRRRSLERFTVDRYIDAVTAALVEVGSVPYR